MYRYDEHIPCNLFVVDDTVILGASHTESGHPYACLVTQNPTVRSWGLGLIERYRTLAEPLESQSFQS